MVSGASDGIGRAVTLALAAEGARLAIGARRTEKLDAVAAKARALGAEVATVAGDLVRTDAIDALVATAARYGRIDGVAACVGSTPLGSFSELSDERWQTAFDMKFLATVRLVRAALPWLGRQGGRVVIVGGNSYRAPASHMATSAAINAALLSLAVTISLEYAPHGVGAVCVDPGPVRTQRFAALSQHVAGRLGGIADAETQIAGAIPNGRIGAPEDVAATAAFLLSPRAAHIVGTAIAVDGGQAGGR